MPKGSLLKASLFFFFYNIIKGNKCLFGGIVCLTRMRRKQKQNTGV